jgi:hypothetical protein
VSFGVKFLIRIILSLGLAVILSRLFFHPFSYAKVFGLAGFLLAMGYMAEYIRKQQK